MRRIIYFLFFSIICLVPKQAIATVYQVDAASDILSYLNSAADGDIIELTTSGGTYNWSAMMSITTEKSITIRAASGLSNRPVVKWTGAASSTMYFIMYNLSTGTAMKTWTFEGIDFDGSSGTGALLYMKCPSATANINVVMNNCIIRNLIQTTTSSVFKYVSASSSPYGDLTVANSEFRLNNAGAVLNSAVLSSTPKNVSFTNCLFVGPSAFTAGMIRISTAGYNSFTLNHCTFTTARYPELYVTAGLNTFSIKNTIFANSTNSSLANSFGGAAPITLGADCGIYYTGSGTKSTIYPNSTAALSTNPLFDASMYATATEYLTGSTDGLPIGYYNPVILNNLHIGTQSASTVTSNSAILNGTIVSLGNSAITSYGFCWNTTGTPTISDSKINKGAISATGSFTHSLTGLAQGTKYYVRAYATNADSTTYGSVVEFTTLESTDPGTANLTHQWTFDNGTANDAIGTVNGVLQGGAIIENKALKTSTAGDYLSFNGAALGLNSYTSLSTEIWFTSSAGSNTGATMLSYIGNSIGTYGYNYLFTTASNSNKSRTAISCGNTSSPWTTENGVNSLKYDDGLQHQMVSVLNSSGITFYVDGVKIGTTAYTGSNNIASIGTSLAYLAKSGYSTDPTWIGSIHKYSIYNKALTDNEVIYLFTQGAENANGVDLVTSPASSITAASATFNGTMTLSGSTSVSSYGFCWNSTGAPTISNNKVDLGASSTSGAFTKDITGLLGATTYYVRSYATVNGLTVYGNVQSFTTSLPDAYTITLGISTGGAVIDNTVTLTNGNVISVNRGATKTFTFIPDAGYKVVGLTYNGVDMYSQIVNNQYTTAAVNAYGVLNVAFGNGIKTIHLASAGTLSSMLTSVEKSSITSLTVTGNIDARDVKCMRDEMPLLSTLDLKDASIIAYTGNGGTYFTTFSSTYPANQMPIYSFTDILNGTGSKTSLVNVELPNSLTSIGREAFNNCNNLKTLTIGRLVTSIDDMAFFSCSSINTIKCLSQTPPTLGISSFDLVSPAVVFVPVGKVPTYKAATGWSSFNIVEYKIKPTTQAATAIKLVTAKLNGSVDVITDSPVTAHGFCWNTTGTPTIADSKVDNGAKTTEGSFSNEISGLTEATTYYVRAYATDGTSGTVYGEEISFSTAEIPTSSTVGGNYYNSQYWPKSKSPYTVNSNVNMAIGTTLTIEPGVVVNFVGSNEIMCMGNIIANGLAGDSISFYSSSQNGVCLDFKNAKLSDSELSYVRFAGVKQKANIYNNIYNYSTAIKTQGTCLDSLKLDCSRLQTISLSSDKNIFISKSQCFDLFAGSTMVHLRDAQIDNCQFGDSLQWLNANLIINHSTVKALKISCPIPYYSYYNISNSKVLESNLGISQGRISASKLYNCGICTGDYFTPAVQIDSTLLLNCSLKYSGNYTINQCIFKSDTIKTINISGTINQSQFIGNNNKLGGIGLDAVSGTITNSSIVNHRIGLQTNSLTINNSNLINISQYAIKNTGTTQIDAKNNFWGVGNTTTATVKAKIWDYYKDMNLGKVLYDNYQTTPNVDCPITPPQNFRKAKAQTGINYSWNANPESDTKGYKLYYGKSDGFTFANVIDLGNVTSYNLPTALINDTVLVTAYDLQADGVNDMLEGHESWYSEDVPLPAKAGLISGATTVCQGQNSVTYSVPAITNATLYIWTLPTGAIGTSTTNSITVNYSTTATSGDISVFGRNEYGDGANSTKAVTVNSLPDAAGTITGTSTVCQGTNSVTYSVPLINNASSYLWTLPTGVTGTSTTNTITVNFGTSAVSGNVTVKGVNGCGNGVVSTLAVTVNPLPVAAGTIVGSTSVCQGQNAVTYTVPPITNATTYSWTLPSGATGTSTTNTITVSFSNTATSGNITVKGHNDCGDGLIKSLAITVKPLLGTIGTISGTASLCAGTTGATYSIPAVDNATSYVWTLPGGASGTSTSNSIVVNYSNIAISGNITVKAINDCGETAVKTLAITVKPLLGTIGTITGTASLCAGTTGVTYSIPAVDNATSYVWTLPTGASGTSTTNSIVVNFSNTASSGNISVKAINDCGETAVKTLAITIKPLLGTIGIISGTASLCAGTTGATYSIPAVDNATSYVWTLPTGASGTSTSNSIVVNFSNTASSGNISVKAINDCGETAVKTLAITVKPLLGTIGAILGTASLCAGTTGTTYSIPAVDNATSYVWTLPTGASGTSTTNSIVVNFSNTASSGSITVKAINDCGETAVKTLAITVKPLLGTIGTISGTASLCAGTTGVTYSIPAVDNATGYVWTLPGGASGTSTSNSIVVNFSNIAISGNITVKAINECGETAVKTLAITVKPLLGTIGTISGTATLCAGTTGTTYSIPAVDNATSYVWTLPTGASGTSTTNSIVVNFSNTASSGNITVKAINDCGETAVKTLAITVKPLLGAIGTISGITSICVGTKAVTYSVESVANAQSYVWTLPAGMTGTSTTNSITVDFVNDATSREITVKAQSDCNETSLSKLPITVIAKPATPIIVREVNVLHSNSTIGNQWYNSKGIIIGATNQDLITSENESYYTIVTNICESEKSNIITITNTATNHLIENTFKLYPNPVKDELTVDCDGTYKFEIVDMIGKICNNGTLSNKTIIKTSSLTSGMYILRLYKPNSVLINRFIKE